MQQITGPGQAGSRPPDTGKLVEDSLRILGVLKRGWRLITLAVVLCMAVAVLYLVRARTEYQAAAQVLVMQKGPRPLGAGASAADPLLMTNDSLATHLMIIRSPAVVGRALESSGLRGLSVGTAIRNLGVKQPDERANIIELTYRAETSDVARSVLEAVVESYGKFLKANYQENASEVVAYIVEARDKLSRELTELEQQYLEYQRKNPSYTDEDGKPLATRRLELWVQTANQAMARAMQLKTQLELGQQLASQGASLDAITNALNQLAGVSGGEPIPLHSEGNDQRGFSGSTLGQVMAELAAVENRKRMAELLLENLRRQAASRPIDESQVVRLFYADPRVAELQGAISEASANVEDVSRVAVKRSDAARRHHEDTLAALRQQLDQLWREMQPRIIASLQNETGAISEAEASLTALEAQEKALRARAAELRQEQLDGLRKEHQRLTTLHGSNDAKVTAVAEQIAALEQGQGGKSTTANSLIDSIALSLEAIKAMQGEVQGRFEADLTASQEAETRQLEEENLRKNLERQRALFDSVTAQLKQAQLGSDYESISAEVITPPAVSTVPSKTAFILIFALFAGCGLGGAAAFVVDLLDPRVRTLTEVRTIFDTPLVAVIPQQFMLEANGVEMLCQRAPRSSLAESYRSARTNLEFLRRNRKVQVLLVSSPNPGDGKTTTASNLAISLAHAGRRVLLIDGDLRKSSLHAIHNLGRDRGLAGALGGQIPAREAVQRTTIPNLDLIASGPAVPNPAELLASDRLGELLDELRPHYDVILIDSSPLLTVTDPSIISASADALLLVVRIEDARRQDAERTIELLRTLGTPILGAVVNGVSHKHLNHGYGYGYGQPYGHPVAEDEWARPESGLGLPAVTGDEVVDVLGGRVPREDAHELPGHPSREV